MLARRDRAREQSRKQHAQPAGESRRTELFVGGSQLRLRRSDLRAVVNLQLDETSVRCRRAPDKDYADAVFVEPD